MIDDAGPTAERLLRAEGFFTVAGKSRSGRRISMLDDALGRAWMRKNISAEEYSGLKRYAYHWASGGLGGHIGSVDLNRILAFDPGAMSGLAKTESQVNHRNLYHASRAYLGTRPALVADHIACYDSSIAFVGCLLGYKSPFRGREKAIEILSDAGYRLGKYWSELSKRR